MSPAAASRTPVVTLLGDSLSAGYGLKPNEALPARLQAALADVGMRVEVLGAGVDGDTALDGLTRMDTAVPMRTDLCVVALGANDLMQGRPPEQIGQDLGAIVSRLQACQTEVLLCGMKAPPWLTDYALAFDAVFPTVAARHGVPLYPFLLDGVALDPRFNQRDRIHPNAEGVEVIARRLAPTVRDVLATQLVGAR